MDVDDVLLDAEERMDKAAQVFAEAVRGIRTGSASAGLVESIKVDYFGSPTPLSQVTRTGQPLHEPPAMARLTAISARARQSDR